MSLISFVSLLVLVAMANASDSNERPHYDVGNAQALFDEFVKEHSKVYKDDADKEVHFHAFVSNLEQINKMNEGNPSAVYGINKFSDYTDEEKKNMRGFKKN